jgi:hypothetical protein
MASKCISRSLLRQQYLARSSIAVTNPTVAKCSLESFISRRRAALKRQRNFKIPTRALSTLKATRYAKVEDSLDFREQDRESDEVDVCIVGGGIRSTYILTSIG